MAPSRNHEPTQSSPEGEYRVTARRKLVIVSASLACLIGGYTVVAVVGFSLLDLFFTPLVRSQGRWADGVGYVSRLEAEGFIQFGALLAGVVLTVVGFKTTSKDATTVGRKLLVISVSFAGLIGGYFLVPVVAISLTPVFFPVPGWLLGLIQLAALVAGVVLAVVGFKTTSKDAGVQPAE